MPDALKTLVDDCEAAWASRGGVKNGPTPAEEQSLAFRRSLYVVHTIAKGEAFTTDNIKSIRPAHGLPPKYLPKILNRPATRPLERGEPLEWSMIDVGDNSNS